MLLLAGSVVIGCRDKSASRGVMMNESLRLTPEQIASDERAAQSGDAAAAKRLWHHYDFVAGDYQKGEMWRTTYEKLSKEAEIPKGP